MKPYRKISLFAGIGGFGLAAARLGWQNVAHVEIEPGKRELLKMRFPEEDSHDNVETFNGTKYTDIDVISGGFPCQDISIAQTSRKTGGGTRD